MKYPVRALLCAACCLGHAAPALAHAIVGDRIFPATLAIDDPGVSDELTLPQVTRVKQQGDGGAPSAWTTDTGAEFDKRITDNFALSISGDWLDEQGTRGLDNIDVGAKYVFLANPEHELMLSAGLDDEIGGTGATRVGADRFSTITPALFFGKGMGDIPDALDVLKPFALTGTLGYAVPTQNFSTDPDSGDRTRNSQAVEWGFTMQYSLPYLQQHVKDIGLPKPFGSAIPIVEFAFVTPTGGAQAARTTGTVNPGVIFMGQEVQLGLEALLPLNHDSGNHAGFIAQAHFYLDDIFPGTIGRPLF